MAKDDGQGNQLNLTVVALVALVAIVGLVALVLNTASLAKISTGGTLASAQDGGIIIEGEDADEQVANLAGQLTCWRENFQCINGQWGCHRYRCTANYN